MLVIATAFLSLWRCYHSIFVQESGCNFIALACTVGSRIIGTLDKYALKIYKQ